ncbi:MAG TPA: hypothetical protein VGL81_00655 [Polyangiaceae bacterium]|jgi:hypothetical protein
MRRIALALSLLLTGCDDATGVVQGGQALVSQEAGPPTWTGLYDDYFGPSGVASCTAQSSCHGTATQAGAQTSGFVCGATKDECWAGVTMGVNPVDAGGVFCPIVCIGADAGGAGCPQNTSFACPTDPTQQALYTDIHKTSGGGLDNMPCGGNLVTCPISGSTYTFTADDLARISTWIQQGAQDN